MAQEQIDYDHERNRHLHTVDGAERVLTALFKGQVPSSVLDIGCGTGTWMRAALNLGVKSVFGVEGIDLPESSLHVSKELIELRDLNMPVRLQRTFDLVITLETAEHLEPPSSEPFVQSIVTHADTVLFSAALPGQSGTHHVNCREPSYWQGLFNQNGFVCDDAIRWEIWDDKGIEPWYRQNAFITRKDAAAGSEKRIKSVIHPDMLWLFVEDEKHKAIVEGLMPVSWYVRAPLKALSAKVRRFARWQGSSLRSQA
jgi:SAM-dependent methyltransferase